MNKRPATESAFFRLCLFFSLLAFFIGVLLAMLASANPKAPTGERARFASEQVAHANNRRATATASVYAAWVARYNGPWNFMDEARAIAVDDAGNVYVTGGSDGVGIGLDYATIKYNSAGQQQWVARYNGPVNGEDEADAIAVDSSGNVYVTGRSPGAGTADDYATIKYNSAGQEQWVARFDGLGHGGDDAYAIALDSSGNV